MDAYTITATLQAKMQSNDYDLTDGLHEALAEAIENAIESAINTADEFDAPDLVADWLHALGNAAINTAHTL